MLRMFRHYVAFPAIVLASFEALIFFTILMGLSSLPESAGGMGGQGQTLAALMTGAAFLLMSSVGFYNRDIISQTQTLLTRAAVTFPLMFLLCVLLTQGYHYLTGERAVPVMMPLIALAVFAPLTVLLRSVFLELVSLKAFRRRVLVIGAGRQAAKIEALARRPRHHFHTVGYVDLRGGARAVTQAPLDGAGLLSGGGLGQFVRENGVDEIVIASDEQRGLPVRQLLDCKLLGLRVTDFATFYEREAGEIDLHELRPSWLIFSDGFKLDRGRMVFKRLFDVVVSGTFLLLTLPISLLTALAIRLESPGPIFYRQERVGLNGAVFHVLKFRSMRVDAEKDGPQWAKAKDSRVTAVGAFIRKTRIDEIPQVLTVLKGDMSFIGPRPERPMFVAELRKAIPYYDERHRMKPGITGWAQINYPYGASVEDAWRKLAYDLYYIKNGSLFLDLIILAQTVRVILWAEGAR